MTAPLVKILQQMQKLFRNLLAALESMIIFPTRFRDRTRRGSKTFPGAWWPRHSLDDVAQEIDQLFNTPLSLQNMLAMSEKMREEMQTSAKSSTVSMLPSYLHALPTGNEKGEYLAIDVGGSTFRVALIHLNGKGKEMKILRVASSAIGNDIKALEGTAFFDWMAVKIDAMLAEIGKGYGRDPDRPLAVGVSWSFPIDQTSNSSGRVIHMGKGFLCSNGTVGQELGSLIVQSCRTRKLSVRVDAIVNDGSATLLSRAYLDPTTRMSLILGTGTNVAIHFPVHGIGLAKFGVRPAAWFENAKHVIVNSELSMFGGSILPMTRWDEILNRTHLRPGYQPLEYMITGRYLGEIVRLIAVEAVETAGLFGGELPGTLREPYSLDTSLLASLEADTSPNLLASATLFEKQHKFRKAPTVKDLEFLHKVSGHVSRRAAGYLATAIHSIWSLRNDLEFTGTDSTLSVASTKKDELLNPEVNVAEIEEPSRNLSIACEGSVINKYPGFRDRCQAYLDLLTQYTNSSSETLGSETRPVTLALNPESAIFGAAVAVAVSRKD